MKLLFFDLETTGTNPGRNGIHQISGQVVIDGIVKEQFDFHVQPNPKAAIEDEALAVAGVTREQIAQYPAMGTVYRQFVAMLGKYVDKYNSKDKFFLVGYNNAAFDNQFLRGFFLAEQRQVFWFMVLGKFNGCYGSCNRVSCKQAHGNGEFQIVNGCGNAWCASGW